MVKSILPFIFVMSLTVVGSVPVEAGNGRGQGTATVCDEANLIGAAYGACNVYCEALNCDGLRPNGPASSCERALDRFMELTGELPPCEPVCPCAAAWRAADFFPESPTLNECLVELNEAGFAHLHAELIDQATGSSAYASVDFWDSSDPNDPMKLVACSTMQGPDPWGAPGTGGFELINRYPTTSERFDRLQRAIFNSCRVDFLALVEQLGLECVVNDLSGE